MILDTNAVSALLAGEPLIGELLAPSPRHHLPVVVIGEYRYGLLISTYGDQLLPVFQMLIRESTVLHVDEATTEHYAIVRHELRTRGRPIPENDVWIAALARQHAQPIVSRDDHFDELPELERLAW